MRPGKDCAVRFFASCLLLSLSVRTIVFDDRFLSRRIEDFVIQLSFSDLVFIDCSQRYFHDIEDVCDEMKVGWREFFTDE